MEHQLLDNDLIEKKEKRSIINWATIIILWLGIGRCIASGFFGTPKLTIAIILLSITSVVMFKNYAFGVKLTFGLLLIGLFKAVDFFPFDIYFEFGANKIGIGIDLLFIGIAAIHVLTNKEEASKFLGTVFRPSEAEAKLNQRTKINSFKKRFSNKKLAELEIIATNDKLIPEAGEAAKELIKEIAD